MGGNKRALGIALVVLGAGLVSVPARAVPTTFLVGAATVDITPPARPSDFPACPAAVFTGARLFAFEEPYIDAQHLGHFEYPDPFCDANGNGRYDGLYLSGGVDVIPSGVHDPIDARALAIDGVVIVSVVAQGLFNIYGDRIRAEARRLRPGIADVLISANHNESSPDPIGIYGAPDSGQGFGLRSGIDDYYMDYLVDRTAHAAVAAFDGRRPATLRATQVPVPADVRIRLSDNFPTTGPGQAPAAVDPKIGVLQARDEATGRPVATVMSLAAHNQEVGHSGSALISADWPGAFHRALEADLGGMAMFLVGDNGSIEDPVTVPPVPGPVFDQAQATGVALAHAVTAAARDASPLRPGPVVLRRTGFPITLENNLFKGAYAAGILPPRPFVSSVEVVDVGPDLQLLGNPGEAFPALMLGSPWTRGDASCPDRPNPPVPTWHARAAWKFQVGLADDMLGYLLPPWGFATQPGVYLTACTTDAKDRDARGHQHKLEDESVGPMAGAQVANALTVLLDNDPLGRGGAAIEAGTFVMADGTTSSHPAGAVAVRLADGRRLSGTFVDYDGVAQTGADVNTRGVRSQGQTVFVDVFG